MLLRFAGFGANQTLRHRLMRPLSTVTAIKGSKSVSQLVQVSTSRTSRCFSSEIQPLHESESFLTGTSSLYAEQMYEQYLDDPNSIHPSWKMYFDTIEEGLPYDESAFNKPTAAASSVKRAISGVRCRVLSILFLLVPALFCCLRAFSFNIFLHLFAFYTSLMISIFPE